MPQDDVELGGLDPGTRRGRLTMHSHQKPIEMLEAGDWRTVLGLIDALAEGIFV